MLGSEFGEYIAPAAVHDRDCIHYQAPVLGQLRQTIGYLFEQAFGSIFGSESQHREYYVKVEDPSHVTLVDGYCR